MTDATFDIAVISHVDEKSLKPYVILQVTGTPPSGIPVTVAVTQYAPSTARRAAMELLEAAEAAEHTATTVLALREQKVSEETVLAVLKRIKERRDAR